LEFAPLHLVTGASPAICASHRISQIVQIHGIILKYKLIIIMCQPGILLLMNTLQASSNVVRNLVFWVAFVNESLQYFSQAALPESLLQAFVFLLNTRFVSPGAMEETSPALCLFFFCC
jgi:hypothetical protein